MGNKVQLEKSVRANLFRLFAITLLVSGLMCFAHAGEIYKWKDVGGVTHFSDDLSNVPVQYRKNKRIIDNKPKMRPKNKLGSTLSDKSLKVKRQLWLSKCAECHTASGGGWNGDKLGLHKFIMNRKTNYPLTARQILPQFRYAVDGRTSDMAPVEISDEDILAIVSYMIESLE